MFGTSEGINATLTEKRGWFSLPLRWKIKRTVATSDRWPTNFAGPFFSYTRSTAIPFDRLIFWTPGVLQPADVASVGRRASVTSVRSDITCGSLCVAGCRFVDERPISSPPYLFSLGHLFKSVRFHRPTRRNKRTFYELRCRRSNRMKQFSQKRNFSGNGIERQCPVFHAFSWTLPHFPKLSRNATNCNEQFALFFCSNEGECD